MVIQRRRRWLLIGRAVAAIVVLSISLAACYGFDPLYSGDTPPPIIPTYPQRQQAQERVIRRPWATVWIATFRTPDSPAQLEAFYQRQLGPTGARWYSAKGLGYPEYQTNPLLWMYDNDYCPATSVDLSWTISQPGMTDARVQVSEGYCGYFALWIVHYMIRQALDR